MTSTWKIYSLEILNGNKCCSFRGDATCDTTNTPKAAADRDGSTGQGADECSDEHGSTLRDSITAQIQSGLPS